MNKMDFTNYLNAKKEQTLQEARFLVSQWGNFLWKVFLFVCILFMTVWLALLIAWGFKEPITNAQSDILAQDNVDPNLQHGKPVERWRINSNGYSQRYIELSWTTRDERMIDLLAHYEKAPDYKTRQVIARVYRVYPEVLICIAYADSSLWNFLKTANNFGNVGNNDRGDKVSFITPEAGVNAIGKTLNNGNLSYISTINMLSRYGNKTWMVYATAPENHFNNVANCIGMIRNKWVPDNFKFRW